MRSVVEWSAPTRFFFRLSFAYLILYNLPFPLDSVPLSDGIAGWYGDFWNAIVVFVGKAVFRTDITVRPAGSGDTTWNYVQLFCFAILATAAALIWTAADSKRANYSRLLQCLNVYVRFSLAAAMISYGSVKIIKAQFPDLTLDALIQPFGDSSPMGLLWKFMGASLPFNVFTGLGETLGGLLLMVRRTRLLGAMLCVVVMSNVVMLNFSYDVPVKLYSMHLLAMAVWLTIPDWRRLANLFLLNRPAPPAEFQPLFSVAWRNQIALALKVVLVVAFTGWSLYEAYEDRRAIHDPRAKSPLYGIWVVDEFQVNGEIRPAVAADETRWRRVVFDRPDLLAIQLMSDSRVRYLLDLDEDKRQMALAKRGDPKWSGELSYQRVAQDRLTLEGKFGEQQVRASLRRVDAPTFRLVSRGFRWINEFSDNQ